METFLSNEMWDQILDAMVEENGGYAFCTCGKCIGTDMVLIMVIIRDYDYEE